MRARIHHGANEIGGNCVEVEHDGARLVLDVGRPLTAERGEHVPLPDVAGLADDDTDPVLGVVISHHHQDHWGLIDQIRPDTPVFMGEATERILRAAAFWTTGSEVPVAGHLEHRTPFALGPFTITPYLNDHSAFDAYSVLIEADGQSLFYTGDIRGHGRKKRLFEQLLTDPPVGVDTLLMEGTNLQVGQSLKPVITESAVEHDMAETFRSTDGMALVVTSAQNIDRLVTIYRAAKRAGRRLVMDPYTADIARATGYDTIPRPHPDWEQVDVYMPLWQSVRIKKSEEFDRLDGVDGIKPYRLYPEKLAQDPSKYVLLFSSGDGKRLAEAGALVGATCTYSLWAGYLDEPSGTRLRTFLDDHGIPLVHHHTSGHASVEDLGRLAEAIGATRVVPIHTFGGASFSEFVDNVDVRGDGEWWDVVPRAVPGGAATPGFSVLSLEVAPEGAAEPAPIRRVDFGELNRALDGDGNGDVAVHEFGFAWTVGIPQLVRLLDQPSLAPWFPRPPRAGDMPEHGAAYWAPLLFMLLFRLGWVRPDRGLSQWNFAGRPTGERHLDLLARLWAEESDLDPFLAWAARSVHFFERVHFVVDHERTHSPIDVPGEWIDAVMRREEEAPTPGSPLGGDTDPLHLSNVLWSVDGGRAQEPQLLVDSWDARRGAVVVDDLCGWFEALHRSQELLGIERESDTTWQWEVLVRGMGSLGRYRRSPETGIFHATTELIHRWGV